MRGVGGRDCPFCGPHAFDDASVRIENDLCIYASGSSLEPPETLPGAGIVIPKAHRESPFELTHEEWTATGSMLAEARAVVHQRWSPDGYNLIWNVGRAGGQNVAHVHLHLIPRYHDEPYAGRGARWWLKQLDNRRPDPLAPGRGETRET